MDVIRELKHKYSWHSQPNETGMTSGNISLAASIVLLRETFERVSKMMQTPSVPFLSKITFCKIQMTLLVPAIHPILTTQRQLLYVDAHECGEINFLGDRKGDLPDYNVKYSTYTILDSQKVIITNFHVSHVGLAGISKIMELNGLKYVLQRLHYNSVEIAFLTSNRHKQVCCCLRKNQKYIYH